MPTDSVRPDLAQKLLAISAEAARAPRQSCPNAAGRHQLRRCVELTELLLRTDPDGLRDVRHSQCAHAVTLA